MLEAGGPVRRTSLAWEVVALAAASFPSALVVRRTSSTCVCVGPPATGSGPTSPATYLSQGCGPAADRAWHPFSKIDFKGQKKRQGHSVCGQVLDVRDQT